MVYNITTNLPYTSGQVVSLPQFTESGGAENP